MKLSEMGEMGANEQAVEVSMIFQSEDDAAEVSAALDELGLTDGVEYRWEDDANTIVLTDLLTKSYGAVAIADVVDAMRGDYEFEVVGLAEDFAGLTGRALEEAGWERDEGVLAEANPYHDTAGKFGNGATIPGSWALRAKQRKVVKGKGAKPVVRFTKVPCGRLARKQGRNVRCYDGKQL